MPSALNGTKVGSKGQTKTSKVIPDKVKSFNSAIYELRNHEVKESWNKLDKTVKEMLKLSDFQSISEQESLLLNMHWILTKNSASKGIQTNVIQILVKFCVQVPWSRVFLRDELGLVRTLTYLMTTLEMNKILELLRYIVHGISILRQESWLEKLILQLLSLTMSVTNSNDEGIPSSSALAILASLCHGNYVVGKLLLSNMTTEQRKELYSREYPNARSKIFLDHLLTTLNRRHFLTQPPKHEAIEQQLALLSDAFCSSYPENDLLAMRLCIDFANDLQKIYNTEDHKTLRESVFHTIKQIFCLSDFSDGNDEADSLIFSFTRNLATLHGYTLGFLDVTVKTVLLLLESKSNKNNSMIEAIEMLSEILRGAHLDEESDQTLKSSFKLQLDSLLGYFNAILTADVKSEHPDQDNNVNSLKLFQTILQCTLCLAKFSEWNELIANHFTNPTFIVVKLKNSVMTSSMRAAEQQNYCGGPVMASIFELASKLSVENKQWAKTFDEELKLDEPTIKSWIKCFERKCHKNWIGYYFKLMTEYVKTSNLFQSLLCKEDDDEIVLEPPAKVCKSEHLSLNNMKELDKVLKQVSTKIENSNDASSCLTEVWELNQFQLMSQQTKLDALNESLKSADDQIAYQKRLNTQLELENQKLNAFTQKLLCKIKMSQLEMTDLREQCNEITKEASATKNITAKELKDKEEDIEVLEANEAKLKAKVSKYKEQMETLQETIKEHQAAQEELAEKLKTESTQKAELTAALTKKDEKLKKKEKLLNEQTQSQNAMEKELDTTKKEVSSQKTLIKRLETALTKKEKQYNEANQRLATFKAQIFSLSKTVTEGDDSTD